MAKYIFKRILTAIPLIIVITILCFSLIHLAPYDAIDAMTTPKMSPEMVQMIREKYGYDQPVYVQYIRWLEGILNGNFGYSIVTKTNIFDELATRIPNTLYALAAGAAVLSDCLCDLNRAGPGGRFSQKQMAGQTDRRDLFPVDRDADFLGSDALYLSVRL